MLNTVKNSYTLAISAYIRTIITHILSISYENLYGFFMSWIRYWPDDGLNVGRNL